MGREIFGFIFTQVAKIFVMLGSKELWPGFTLLMFFIGCMLVPLVIKVAHVFYDETVESYEEDVHTEKRFFRNKKMRERSRKK